MLIYFLYGVFILACVTLILAVLLQPGKADAGALFTSSVSSATFGPRGTQTLLAKITIGAAVTFMLLALTLSLGVGTQRSVLETEPESPAAPAQPVGSPAAATPPQNSASPAAATPEGDSNSSGGGSAPAGAPATTAPSPAANDAGGGGTPQASPPAP